MRPVPVSGADTGACRCLKSLWDARTEEYILIETGQRLLKHHHKKGFRIGKHIALMEYVNMAKITI
jgi:hypothetical protein